MFLGVGEGEPLHRSQGVKGPRKTVQKKSFCSAKQASRKVSQHKTKLETSVEYKKRAKKKQKLNTATVGSTKKQLFV